MARSRNIKPGFFKNEQLAELPPLTRLLFAGLWLLADREGRLEDRPKRIKVELLPYDNSEIDKMLDQLYANGFIIRYAADKEKYIQISNFVKHQNPHCKEPASSIPAPDQNGTQTVMQPLNNGKSRADSLNLIPDSLNPLTLPLPDNLPAEKWGEWVAYRKERKLTTSKQTWKKQLTMLAAEQNPGEMIDQSILNGWQGLFSVKTHNGGKINGTRHEHLARVSEQLTGRVNGHDS